jgi:hypothetical protein
VVRPVEDDMDEQKPPSIATLASTYPDASQGVGLLVLREFRNIQRARARGWKWPAVADSLGRPGQGRSVAQAFSRVKKRVEAKTLEPPDPTPAPQPARRPHPPVISTAAAKGENPAPSRPGFEKIDID